MNQWAFWEWAPKDVFEGTMGIIIIIFGVLTLIALLRAVIQSW